MINFLCCRKNSQQQYQIKNKQTSIYDKRAIKNFQVIKELNNLCLSVYMILQFQYYHKL